MKILLIILVGLLISGFDTVNDSNIIFEGEGGLDGVDNSTFIQSDIALFDYTEFEIVTFTESGYKIKFIDDKTSKSYIKDFGKRGLICKVYGHRWEDITPNVIYTSYPAIFPNNCRVCMICDKEQVEKKTSPVWEDVIKKQL